MITLILFIILVGSTAGEVPCTGNCTFTNNGTHAKCSFKNFGMCHKKIEESMITPSDIEVLDLSANGILTIPDGVFRNFTNLKTLNLSMNMIATLSNKAFTGLVNLQTLDLTWTLLQEWETGNLPELKSLQTIINKDNPWSPSLKIFSHPSLMNVTFVGFKHTCLACSFIRNTKNQTPFNLDSMRAKCFSYTKEPPLYLEQVEKYGFIAEKCEFNFGDPNCFQNFDKFYEDSCWLQEKKLSILTLVIGLIAIFENVLVLGLIIGSPKMRSSVPCILLALLAGFDLLTGIHSFGVSVLYANASTADFQFHIDASKACEYIGFVGYFWPAGAYVSFLITLERYITIIYVMKPGVRMRKRTIALLMAACFVQPLLNIIILYGVEKAQYTITQPCYPPKHKSKALNYTFDVSPLILGALSYLFLIGLYVRMYRFVKRNTLKQTRAGKEVNLAKKAGLVVLTNFIFSFIPLCIFSFSHVNALAENILDSENAIASYLFLKWFGVICQWINAIINPILYAFRLKLFRSEISRFLLGRSSIKATTSTSTTRTARNTSLSRSSLGTINLSHVRNSLANGDGSTRRLLKKRSVLEMNGKECEMKMLEMTSQEPRDHPKP